MKGYFGLAPARPIYRHHEWSHDRMTAAQEGVTKRSTNATQTAIDQLEDMAEQFDPRYMRALSHSHK